MGVSREGKIINITACWTLVCLVHNIEETYARIMAREGELDDLTGELQVVCNPT